MVGGPLLRFCHNLAELVGADFACLQADQAQMQALELIKKTPVSSAVKPASA
jgi:hypothetical protein